MRTLIWMAPALESTARKAERGDVVSMRPGFFVSCSPAKIARRASMDPKGQGGFVSCSPAVVYVTIRQFHQEKRTKGRRRWAVLLRSEAFVGPGGWGGGHRMDTGAANGSRAFKDDTLSGTRSSASDHGPGMSLCLSTRPRARRCHVVPLATAAYEINWTPPNLWHVARDPSCCDTPPNSILDFLGAN